jgi:hypothetical protein
MNNNFMIVNIVNGNGSGSGTATTTTSGNQGQPTNNTNVTGI